VLKLFKLRWLSYRLGLLFNTKNAISGSLVTDWSDIILFFLVNLDSFFWRGFLLFCNWLYSLGLDRLDLGGRLVSDDVWSFSDSFPLQFPQVLSKQVLRLFALKFCQMLWFVKANLAGFQLLPAKNSVN